MLADASPGSLWEEIAPEQKSGAAHQLLIGGQVALKMLEGGRYALPHLVATGSAADDSATLIRIVAPSHSISRADVCEDLEAPGWFDQAFGVMRDLARADRISPGRQGDWDSDTPARSFYLGSTKSAVRVRLYEKGQEMRAKYPQAADQFSSDWVRLECQVRPSAKAKRLLSSKPAAEFWGCSAWSRKLAGELLHVDAPRVQIGTIWNPNIDLERTEYHFLLQYKSMLAQRAALEGSYEAMGAYYERMVAQMDARR